MMDQGMAMDASMYMSQPQARQAVRLSLLEQLLEIQADIQGPH